VPVYDWQHRRVSKTVSNWNASASLWSLAYSLRFAYHGWNVAAEYDQNNNLTRSHTWGTDLSGSMQGAGGVGGLLMTTFHSGAYAGTYYPTRDGNGNVRRHIRIAYRKLTVWLG
jgi:hypothetical protein